MNKAVQIIVGVLVLVVVAGGSFYGGMAVGKTQAEAALPFVSSQAGGFPAVAGGQGGGFPADAQGRAAFGQGRQMGTTAGSDALTGMTVGQIESAEGQTLVVADANGQRIRVQVTDTTLIEKNASVTVAELEVGETVMISGSENGDGSITARSVQAAPAGRLGSQSTGGAAGVQ